MPAPALPIVGYGWNRRPALGRSPWLWLRRKSVDNLQEVCEVAERMDQSLDMTFAFVDELPKREKSKWQQFRETWEVAKAKGPLLPASLAAKLCDVSRQRIDELMIRGKLDRVDLCGHVMVTESSLVAWLQAPDDKGGRPPKLPDSVSEYWKLSKDWAKEQRTPRKK